MLFRSDLRFSDGLRLPGTGKRDTIFDEGRGPNGRPRETLPPFLVAQVEFSAASARLQGPRGPGFGKAASIISARYDRLIRLLDAQLRGHALRAVAMMAATRVAQPGSMPWRLSAAAASGAVRNLIRARAASGDDAFVWRPAEKTVIDWISAGIGPR